MAIGISPLVDFAFKLVLGNPDHPQVTIHFLNSLLKCRPRVRGVTILNPFLGKESLDDKELIFDVRARDDQGREINIEMQTNLPQSMAERLTYYAANLLADQLYSGDSYQKLNPAVGICVLSKPMFPQVPPMHLEFRLREEQHGLHLTDALQIHLLELSKCPWTADNVSNADPLGQWAFFLRNADQLTVAEITNLLPAPEFRVAAGVLEMISQTPQEKMLYEWRLKVQRDERARLEYAETVGREEGRLKGLQEGRQEGRQEGEILAYQRILGIPESTPEELAALEDDAAAKLARELLQRVLQRSQPPAN